MPIPHLCLSCSQIFPTLWDLQLHCRIMGHSPYTMSCLPCGRSFATFNDLMAHNISDSHKNHVLALMAMAIYGRPIQQPGALSAVSPSSGGPAPRGIPASPKSKIKPPKIANYCQACNKAFPNEAAAKDHLRLVHTPHRCTICSRGFLSAQALQMHHNSLAHVERTESCPLPGCTCQFKSGSGIAHHVENGAHRGITRQQVTKAVKAMDPNNVISLRRIEDAPAPATHLEDPAAEATFDGKYYTCSLCPSRKYRTIQGLEKHASSTAHDGEHFKCPNCTKRFSVVSALAQHVEARGCFKGIGSSSTEKIVGDLTARAMRLTL